MAIRSIMGTKSFLPQPHDMSERRFMEKKQKYDKGRSRKAAEEKNGEKRTSGKKNRKRENGGGNAALKNGEKGNAAAETGEKESVDSDKKDLRHTVQQHEDAILKTSMQFFADELLPCFGIEGKVVSVAPTELIQLEVHKFFQDFNLVMENGEWKHFEFQSKNEGLKGLKRFRVYEALAGYQYNVEIVTYVLYSGRVRSPMTEFTSGINTYRIQPIIMRNHDADDLLAGLREKVEKGEVITKEELVLLTLCPLMDGKMETRERIRTALRLISEGKTEEKELSDKAEAMLFAMADKFLEKEDFEEIKEEIRMLRLTQMLFDEEWERYERMRDLAEAAEEKAEAAEEKVKKLEAIIAQLQKEQKV